jgi:hypothetical protein
MSVVGPLVGGVCLLTTLACAWAAPGPDEPPPRTSLSDPRVRFTVPAKPYAVLRRGPLEAVVVDNRAVDDDVLPGHRAGYHGIALLRHDRQRRNLFVPSYAGLNFEHIHDGTVQPREVLFEPRNAPMELRLIDGFTAELHQAPTPHWGLESCLRYQLQDDGVIELTFECIPRRGTYRNGSIGLFWASYIHEPESPDIHFVGCPRDDSQAQPGWIRGVSPRHGERPTHLAREDQRDFAHDAAFPLTLVFNRSLHRFTEPWYFGVCRGMAFAQIFRASDQVRLSQSPSGGGAGNPAWDFQWFIPNYRVGQRYQLVMRALYRSVTNPADETATREEVLAAAKPLQFPGPEAAADLILHSGKVVTVDARFSIAEAIAVQAGRIVQVSRTDDVLQRRGPRTQVVDLQGRMVLPGLMDSHVHAADACLTEFDHAIPPMERIQDVLDYIQSRTRVLEEGEWIEVRQVFITRLREQRYPTRAELDRVAPKHPVIFQIGPDASLNTLALKRSSIDRDFRVTDGGSGFAEKDPATGELTGILRNCSRYVKVKSSKRSPTRAEKVQRLRELLADYNTVGLTSVCDRDASPDEIETYQQLRAQGGLTVRVSLSHHVGSIGPLDEILANIRRVSQQSLFQQRDDWLRIIGVKTYLDGGMLTGSAYLRQPWGVSEIYGITDPNYRGVLFIPKERLVAMVRAAVECGLQFTAHSVGDGAVHALLDAYAEVDKEMPVRGTRPCISHSNFMSPDAVEQAARLGVMPDIQPAWLYLDAHTLVKQFGDERLRYFQPLRSLFEAGAIAGGGSDHMQKIGSLRSINPYNPFLGMATAITRQARHLESPLHSEEALTREQAIRFYTLNNARLLICDDKLGSLEPGKLADLIVLDTDLLNCPQNKIADAQVLRTYVGGKLVYERKIER